jgi:FtsH-binding integral membrane protein
MKQTPIIFFIAAVAAFVALPVSFNIAFSVLFVAAFLGIVVSDYSRLVRAQQACARASIRLDSRLNGQAATPSRK